MDIQYTYKKHIPKQFNSGVLSSRPVYYALLLSKRTFIIIHLRLHKAIFYLRPCHNFPQLVGIAQNMDCTEQLGWIRINIRFC